MKNICKFTSLEVSDQIFKSRTKLSKKSIIVNLETLATALCIMDNNNLRLMQDNQRMPSRRPLRWRMKPHKQLLNFANNIKLINELTLLVPSNNKYKFNITISNKIWQQDYNNSLNLINNIIIIYCQMRQRGLTESVRIKMI